MTTIAEAVHAEMDRLLQRLTGRINQLVERYATPLPQFIEDVSALSTKVEAHLKAMGFQL